MRILVVEDEPLLKKTLEIVLKKEGYDVFSSPDGNDAIGKLNEVNPDMVITDIMLPFMSGLEIIALVRKTSNIPIMVLSAMSQEHIIASAFNLGTDEFMTKPFSIVELKIRVRKLANRNFNHNSTAIS